MLAHGSREDRVAAAAALLLLAAAGAVWIWFRIHTGIVLEDALITYRYARNIALGHGFVFNPGEQVLGTTTPLLTLILGALGAVFGPDRIPLLSNVLMMSAAAAAAWFAFLAVRAIGGPPLLALLATASFLFHPDTIWTACGGMETPLVLLLMAAGLHALARGRPILAGATASLLVLTRIDGVIWAAGVLLAILARDRRAFSRALLAGAAIAAPWVLFALVYFGSPIPHSVIAKRVLGSVPDPFSGGHLAAYADWVAPFLASAAPFGRVAGITLFLIGAAALIRARRGPPAWLLILFPPIFVAALFLGRSPLYFDWYMVPIALPSLIVGWFGLWQVGGWIAAGKASFWGTRAVLAAAAIVYVALTARHVGETAEFQRAYQVNETGTRRAIGEWLAANTSPDAVVAMEAVGYQAYYSGRRVIDLAGLVSPKVVALRRASADNAEAFRRILEELRPDYLVLRSFEVDLNRHYHGGPLFANERQIAAFAGNYEEVRRFQAPRPDLWGPTSYLTIYRRRDGGS